MWLLPKIKHDKAELPTSSFPELVLSWLPVVPTFCHLLHPVILGDLQAPLSFNQPV